MNKVIFSDFTLQNSQLCKWRYMSSIWVRTKSYLWGNNGEQPEVTWREVTSPKVTWPEETMSGTRSMLCACATGSFAIPLMGPFHRKWRQWSEVIVCACATGTFCITTRGVVQVHGYRRGGRVCACPTGNCAIPPSGAFPPEVGYRKWRHFPRAFFLVVVQKVGWGVLYDARVYPFPWLSAPFIFIITYTVCCFPICCVVLQGWYF